MKRILALVLGSLTMLLGTAVTATAAPPVQTVDQSGGNQQQASATSGATQTNPSNTNISVRVLSPGNDGAVSQTNAVGSTAAATNQNATGQSASQAQGSGGGIQTSGQSLAAAQLAAALSAAAQYGAANANAPERAKSDGSGGSTSQANGAASKAGAGNANATGQSSGQSQAGGGACCPGSGGIQTANQAASNQQAAGAQSTAAQSGASNVNTSVRVGSPGNGGSVTQSNAVGSAAHATNTNGTNQGSGQSQAGGGGSCCPSGSGVQTSDQSNRNGQTAQATSSATQEKPKNVNIAIRVLSPGNDGDVKQSNTAASTAGAANTNGTTQGSSQNQASGSGACCPSGSGIQTATQANASGQQAAAGSSATQLGATNVNMPIRVGSPGEGGSVTQSNTVASSAGAANTNGTTQSTGQSQAGGASSYPCCPTGTGIQTANQYNTSAQGAAAYSTAAQLGASNTNVPIRVGSYGNDGYVSQTNAVASQALAGNTNGTSQSAGQSQAGGGTGIQTLDQKSGNLQHAVGQSAAYQIGASNHNAPVRVGSWGGGGSVTQVNAVSSTGLAGNANATRQSGGQSQAGTTDCHCPGGIGIQALGQHAYNIQGAQAQSIAVQQFPKGPCGCPWGGNTNAPVRVWSSGDDGSVYQANTVSSAALASNTNLTGQGASQVQSGGAGIAIQALGQLATSAQLSNALSGALQQGAKNDNGPIRVISPGLAGSVAQINAVSSGALSYNLNDTLQTANQAQAAGSRICGCPYPSIQALGQSGYNAQLGGAASQAIQDYPKNHNGPASVWSYGNAGAVLQANLAQSLAAASNLNRLLQYAQQLQL